MIYKAAALREELADRSSPPCPRFRFLGSHFPVVTRGQSRTENVPWKIPEIGNFCTLNSCTPVSSAVQSSALLLCPTRDVTHPFVQLGPLSHPRGRSLRGHREPRGIRLTAGCGGACVQGALVRLRSGPRAQRRDAGRGVCQRKPRTYPVT